MARKKTKGDVVSTRFPLDIDEVLDTLVPAYGGKKTSTVIALVRLGIEKHFELKLKQEQVLQSEALPKAPETHHSIKKSMTQEESSKYLRYDPPAPPT